MNFSTISNGFKTAGAFIAVQATSGYNYVTTTRGAATVANVAKAVFSAAASLTMNHKGKLAAVAAFTAVVVKLSAYATKTRADEAFTNEVAEVAEGGEVAEEKTPVATANNKWRKLMPASLNLKEAALWTARKINNQSTALNRFAVGCATLSATGFVATRFSK